MICSGVLRCDRCGNMRPRSPVTGFSDPEPVYWYGDCTCPRPRCPFCRSTLLNGKCWGVDCFLCGNIVPIPDVA